MKPKELGGLLMKIALFISYYYEKKPDLGLPLPERFEKTFAHRSKY